MIQSCTESIRGSLCFLCLCGLIYANKKSPAEQSFIRIIIYGYAYLLGWGVYRK